MKGLLIIIWKTNKILLLGYEWNMQNMQRFEILDNELTFTKIGWIYHFNGIPDETRNYIMDKTHKYFNQ